jgi:radical SAM protein with 4Fe4S-binding SPASM domain
MNPWRPLSVNAEITLSCNLRCRHCGSSAGAARREELSFEEWVALLDQLSQLGTEEMCFLGGEPLLRKDWRALCHAVGDAGMRLVLISNGLLVGTEVAQQLASMRHLDRMGISLDAADPGVHDALRGCRGAHGKAWRALLALRDAGVEVGAITTVTRANLEQLEPLRDLLAGQQMTWQIQIANEGGSRFEADQVLSADGFYRVGQFIAECRRNYSMEQLPLAGSHDIGYHSERFGCTGELEEWFGCPAGLYTLGILSDGRLKGCLSQHDDLIQGSIRERSLSELWSDPALFSRNRRFSPEQLEGGCSGCPHGSTCRAGCAAVAYSATHRALDNPFCFHRIERAVEKARNAGGERSWEVSSGSCSLERG